MNFGGWNPFGPSSGFTFGPSWRPQLPFCNQPPTMYQHLQCRGYFDPRTDLRGQYLWPPVPLTMNSVVNGGGGQAYWSSSLHPLSEQHSMDIRLSVGMIRGFDGSDGDVNNNDRVRAIAPGVTIEDITERRRSQQTLQTSVNAKSATQIGGATQNSDQGTQTLELISSRSEFGGQIDDIGVDDIDRSADRVDENGTEDNEALGTTLEDSKAYEDDGLYSGSSGEDDGLSIDVGDASNFDFQDVADFDGMWLDQEEDGSNDDKTVQKVATEDESSKSVLAEVIQDDLMKEDETQFGSSGSTSKMVREERDSGSSTSTGTSEFVGEAVRSASSDSTSTSEVVREKLESASSASISTPEVASEVLEPKADPVVADTSGVVPGTVEPLLDPAASAIIAQTVTVESAGLIATGTSRITDEAVISDGSTSTTTTTDIVGEPKLPEDSAPKVKSNNFAQVQPLSTCSAVTDLSEMPHESGQSDRAATTVAAEKHPQALESASSTSAAAARIATEDVPSSSSSAESSNSSASSTPLRQEAESISESNPNPASKPQTSSKEPQGKSDEPPENPNNSLVAKVTESDLVRRSVRLRRKVREDALESASGTPENVDDTTNNKKNKRNKWLQCRRKNCFCCTYKP